AVLHELTLSKEEDVLLPSSGETPEEMAKATCVTIADVGIGGDIIIARPKPGASGRFISYQLNHTLVNQVASIAQGNAIVHLNAGRLASIQTVAPGEAEQRAIAEVLSGFDEHLANLDELITKKKAIRDGAVEELVTGRTRIADYRAPWVTRSARELLSDVITGGTPSTTIAEYWDGGIPWLSSTEIHQRTVSRPTRYISEEGLANSSAQIASAGSVLIALAGQGETRGTSAYLTRDMALNQSLAGLVADETELYRGYLLYAVTRRYEELRGLSSGDGGRGGLNKTLLWDLRFTLPSSLEEQCAIAEVLSGMDEEIRSLVEERAKVERLKLGAMDDLLTGRVRLPLKEEAA
ncbi:MAG: restriction endonuclease subunit S, partial [Finegoldia magna]|nr:restriction endonuclease subunit S [Finegoldia magna]